MALTQTEIDLKRYTQKKLTTAIYDIVQSFDIAGIRTDALPCLGVELLRAAAAFCLFCGISREEFLDAASDYYDRSLKRAIKEGRIDVCGT